MSEDSYNNHCVLFGLECGECTPRTVTSVPKATAKGTGT